MQGSFGVSDGISLGAVRYATNGQPRSLLDPHNSWSVANRIHDVLAALPPGISGQASAEPHAYVVELSIAPEPTVSLAVGGRARLRQSAAHVVRDGRGLRAASVGMHPTAMPSEVALSAGARYQEIGSTMGALARREPTMAQHVHVAVPGPASAVRALDGLRSDLPLLLALSANSPFWRGRDSGFASIRTPIFSMFPRVGIAGASAAATPTRRSSTGCCAREPVPEPGFLSWDARLRAHLGTVEVRTMDAHHGWPMWRR